MMVGVVRMKKTWELRFDAGSGPIIPLAIQRENTFLQRLLKEHCRGPYDDCGIEISIDAVLDRVSCPPNPRVGSKTISLKDNCVFAEIYVGKDEWDVAPAVYKRLIWEKLERAIWMCAEEIKKKTAVSEELLENHLSRVSTEFLSEAVIGAKDFEQRIVVQYQIDGHGKDWDFDGKVRFERLLTECLQAPRLGFCDCVDFEDTKVNAICQVSNATMAVDAIVRALRSHNRLSGAVIAEVGPDIETVVWPPNYSGNFSYLG